MRIVEAFQVHKTMSMTTPVLITHDLSKQFFLWTDTSVHVYGAVLEQRDDNGEPHSIAFASRQTNPAESKCAPTDLEVSVLDFGVE